MTTENQNIPRHVPAGSGPLYWGPGDRYTFLVTGEQTGGAYFVMEAFVPPGGGPPLHIHHREHECFYLLEGEIEFTSGEKTIRAGAGDFIHIPMGTPHTFHNSGTGTARMLVILSPAGFENFLGSVMTPAPDRTSLPPATDGALIVRMLAEAPKHGMEIL